jgi:eukaryotic-like serine/threonine-protein kinase
MGSLYLARDPGLDRLVAIKLLKDDLQDDVALRERFIREARSVARLSHPNIVVVYDVGEDAGRPFMAMEFIEGDTLTKVLRQKPSLPVVRRLAFVEDLCAGLAHAHAAGIIHRDIKPDNVMFGRDGVLKILDFGIARLGNSGMTQEGMMMGTLNYMSPEQVTGRGVDHRTDIFAAGAVLYEAISLKQAFPGRGIDTGILHRILNEGPVPLEQIVPGIDRELLGIVQRALERDPLQRYQDASVMRRDIIRVRRRLAEQSAALFDSSQATTPAEAARPPTTDDSRRSEGARRLHPERLAELRRQQVDEHLRFGEEAFARGDHDAALHHAERAATVDPDNRAAFDLIDRARFSIEARAVRQLLGKAQRLLSDGQLEDAAALANEASITFPDVQGAAELRNEVRETLEKIATARARAERIASSLERARSSIDRGGYETALRAVYEVLSIDPDQSAARALEKEAKSRLQAQRELERVRRIAYDQLNLARGLAAEGRFDDAVDAASAVSPPSDTVRAAVADVLAVILKAQRLAAHADIVAKAREAFANARFDEALAALDSIPADDRTADAKTLRNEIEHALRRQHELERKRQALDTALGAVEGLAAAGDLARALERLDDASRIGLDDPRIAATRQRLTDLIAAAEERRRQEARDRLAAKRVEAAEELLANGNGYAAVALLERDGAAHPLVEAALRKIRGAIAQQEERVRQETERRRQVEEEARRRAADEARKAEEQRRQEEEQRRREAERQGRLEQVATLIVNAEKALAHDRPDEATLFLQRAAEHAVGVEDSALRRRIEATRAEAERKEHERQAEIRRREEEARERERALADLIARADATPAHDAALAILGEALTLAPGDPRVETLVVQRRSALEQQRVAEERAREDARRAAEIEAARVRADEARRAEEARQREEQRQREEEARKRERELADLLNTARATAAHDEALGLLDHALTLAPNDARVHTLVHERRSALDRQRAEEERTREEARRRAEIEAARVREEEQRAAEQRRLAEIAETRRREEESRRREDEARRREAVRRQEEEARERENALTAMIDQARDTEAHEHALTILSRAQTLEPNDPRVATLIQTRTKALNDQRTEEARVALERQREREARQKQRQEARAATIASIGRAVADRRVHLAAILVVAIAAGITTWRFWPAKDAGVGPTPPPPTVEPKTEPPASPPVTPPVPKPGDSPVTVALQRAQTLYAGRQRSEALAQLRIAIGADANNRDGQVLLDRMVADARKELQQAKEEANAAGAQSTQNESYRKAVADESGGQRAFNANRRLDALPSWWSAREGFVSATAETRVARDAAETVRRAEEERKAAEAKRTEEERLRKADEERKLAEAKKIEDDRRAAEAKAEAERKALEARNAENARNAAIARRQADLQAISQMLQRYEDAWGSLNPNAVLSLHQLSSAEAASVRRTMNDMRAYRLEVQDPVVQLDGDGQRAVVTATIKRSMTPKVSKAESSSTRTVLTLMKRGDTWVIASMMAQ